MRKLEGVVKEIKDELTYLKDREERFTGTNGESFSLCPSASVSTDPVSSLYLESTNGRVQSFAVYTLFALIGLGVWQIFHLRAFFRKKYLID